MIGCIYSLTQVHMQVHNTLAILQPKPKQQLIKLCIVLQYPNMLLWLHSSTSYVRSIIRLLSTITIIPVIKQCM